MEPHSSLLKQIEANLGEKLEKEDPNYLFARFKNGKINKNICEICKGVF